MAGQAKRKKQIADGESVTDLRQQVLRLQSQLDERTAELRERTAALNDAIEQQSAATEVLQVINSSPGDLTPVFDAMLEKGVRLCEASFGLLMTYDGECFHTVALHGVPEAYAAFLREPIRPAPQNGLGRLLSGERLIHIADITADDAYRLGDPLRVATADLGGSRTHLVVPLLKDSSVLGVIVAYRQEVRPFTDKQIALLENFAAQAVIAMENARLITETREALEQQTATAEVLQVINASPGVLLPVFDTMLEKAHALCGIDHGVFGTFDGERFRAVATRGLAEPLATLVRQPFLPSPGSPHERLMRGESLVRVDDLTMETQWPEDDPKRVETLAAGVRVMVFVPLRKDGCLLGFFTANRREARPFSDREIALLQNFAAQAVIAMENARLITETREALERQTATAEILQVINSSPTDLQPVFQAIADSAARLCDALNSSVYRFDGNLIHFIAQSRFSPEAVGVTKRLFPAPPSRDNATARAVADCTGVHIADVRADPEYRSQEWAHVIGLRSVLSVPMLRQGRPIGVITVNRAEAELFPQAQIDLLNTFADQAVIAVENTRLITETREALEQQTATAEVLQVINSSPGDLGPVFDAMLEKAVRLCDAAFGNLTSIDGGQFHGIAFHNAPMGFAESLCKPRPMVPGQGHYRLWQGEDVVQVEDITADDLYRTGDPSRRALADLAGVRHQHL
jgi:GAF domain-containing protein